MITSGTPNEYRKKLWLFCSGAEYLKSIHHNYYQNLSKISKEMNCEFLNQIDKDLKRSVFKEDLIFIEKVRNVLINYSIRNNSIGYCQGFNFIVENIMQVMENNEVLFI